MVGTGSGSHGGGEMADDGRLGEVGWGDGRSENLCHESTLDVARRRKRWEPRPKDAEMTCRRRQRGLIGFGVWLPGFTLS